MTDLARIEALRLQEQARLDGLRTAAARNELGQFATPPALAADIASLVEAFWQERGERVRFLDPAIGTGSFYSALLRVFGPERVACAHGFELDPAFAQAAALLWKRAGLSVTNADFTTQPPPSGAKYNLLLSNPPYVRHHHLAAEHKAALRRSVLERVGIRLSGLAGLYASFLLLCDSWLAPDALSVWLIPSEFMDVNYGAALREYLTSKVQLLRIHRFCPSDVQFFDALVSSAVVVFRKCAPPKEATVEMSFGGPLLSATETSFMPVGALRESRKWSGFPSRRTAEADHSAGACLGDFFSIRRGLATGSNSFFIVDAEQAEREGIPAAFRRPILPGPRHITTDIINRDADGYPSVSPRLALIDCSLPEEEVRLRHPSLWRYLESGKTTGVHETYLASRRQPWYSQEKRPPAPFVCTYMGRARNGRKPFRVIWNKSDATAANVYLLLYPKPALAAALSAAPELYPVVFDHLRRIEAGTLVEQGRVYGGGLHKVEPKELERVPIRELSDLLHASHACKGQMAWTFDSP